MDIERQPTNRYPMAHLLLASICLKCSSTILGIATCLTLVVRGGNVLLLSRERLEVNEETTVSGLRSIRLTEGPDRAFAVTDAELNGRNWATGGTAHGVRSDSFFGFVEPLQDTPVRDVLVVAADFDIFTMPRFVVSYNLI